ncbi:STM4011 family radical SAM protein [Massilia scottii]|uniref:STM4011 family radical SAM protein n=1 Tax=Massilia scottii TaxID=3057166 RepID=UPI0027965325|nr:STM4011 family radical SAM protein [Massilia sp. CCM 9029]MDQ1831343.1 STM4011 family radical SAM protein [Massilia sp. CCM 9029]
MLTMLPAAALDLARPVQRTVQPVPQSGQPAQLSGQPVEQEVLSLLYRGTLSGCNYDCAYCPFAKRRDSRAKLARDAAEVARFVAWVGAQERPISVLFTPWGEGMIRRHYRDAMTALSGMAHVRQVAIQTNLSGPLAWLEQADRRKVGLWCTYHPSQVRMDRFIDRCERLERMGVRFSVGIVAMREHFDDIRALRAALPQQHYLWLNAYDRRGPAYYRPEDLAWLDAMDPWFSYSRNPEMSRGKACRAGSEALSVDGDGEVQRCHFVTQRLGNLYEDALDDMLVEKPCSRLRKCDCYIGYAHRQELPFYDDFGSGVLARIPLRLAPVHG